MPKWSFGFGQVRILEFFEQLPFLTLNTTWKTTDFLLRNKSVLFPASLILRLSWPVSFDCASAGFVVVDYALLSS